MQKNLGKQQLFLQKQGSPKESRKYHDTVATKVNFYFRAQMNASVYKRMFNIFQK